MTTPRLLIWGEQGIGDELMMATMLADAKRDYDIVFDCHPRLESLHRNSAWMRADGHPITIYPTRKTNEKNWSAACDAKVPIGNIARFYRDEPAKFAWHGPWYTAPGEEVQQYRAHLEKIAAGRKIIGLATRGGTMTTARLYRMMPVEVLDVLLADNRYLLVSLDYEDVSGMGEWIAQKYGPDRFVWHPSIVWHWDYHHTAALIAATDAVITPCQSIAHLSAAMGHPTYVFTPSRPAWRYGQSGEDWFWYPHPNARLLRQIGDSWQPALSRLQELLEARFFADDGPLWPHERTLLQPICGETTMCELGAKANDRGVYKEHFERHGWKHVSIDLNGLHGSHMFDLTVKLDVRAIGGPFDVVTNFGTTEHVDQQVMCWRNVHALVREGGYLVCATPMDWPRHGRWYPTEEWYRDFCALNGYVIEDMFTVRDKLGYHTLCMRAKRVDEWSEFKFPKAPMVEMAEGKVGTYE